MAVITNSTGANTAQVKADGSLVISTPDDINNSGFMIAVGEVASNTGAGRVVRSTDISTDYRLRVGVDNIFWNDVFNHGTFNTYKYLGVTSTMTMTLAGGYLNLNAGASVASAAVARFQTWRTFPILGTYPLYVDIWGGVTQALQTNSIVEFGLGYASGTTAPTDGVFFRYNSGALQGVINYNGSETTTGDLVPRGYNPAANAVYHYLIVIHVDRVEFWIDDNLAGFINVPTSQGGPVFSPSLPLLIRQYNSAATSTAQSFRVSSINVSLGDANTNRLWATQMGGMGQSAIATPDSITPGFLANFTNAAAPASATLSATTASYTTLGGQWQFAAVASSETDNAFFAYQVPTGTASVPGKNLIVRGIRIDTINTGAAVTTTPTAIQWGLAVGGSAIAPTTADSATAGTRAQRRITLGIQSFVVGAAIGAVASPIDINLDAPIICEPGTFFIILMKPFLGAATASQVIRGTCFINGFFE